VADKQTPIGTTPDVTPSGHGGACPDRSRWRSSASRRPRMLPRRFARSFALLSVSLAAVLAIPAAAQTPDGLQRDRSAQVGDLYAFVSPDKPDTVTIITTWGGPHSPADWATDAWFDPDLTYWVKVDNDGDGAEDITWTFRVLSV